MKQILEPTKAPIGLYLNYFGVTILDMPENIIATGCFIHQELIMFKRINPTILKPLKIGLREELETNLSTQT